jgi:hypothetical protein
MASLEETPPNTPLRAWLHGCRWAAGYSGSPLVTLLAASLEGKPYGHLWAAGYSGSPLVTLLAASLEGKPYGHL